MRKGAGAGISAGVDKVDFALSRGQCGNRMRMQVSPYLRRYGVGKERMKKAPDTVLHRIRGCESD